MSIFRIRYSIKTRLNLQRECLISWFGQKTVQDSSLSNRPFSLIYKAQRRVWASHEAGCPLNLMSNLISNPDVWRIRSLQEYKLFKDLEWLNLEYMIFNPSFIRNNKFFPPSGFIYLITANSNIHVFAAATLLSNTNMRNADVGWPKKSFFSQWKCASYWSAWWGIT